MNEIVSTFRRVIFAMVLLIAVGRVEGAIVVVRSEEGKTERIGGWIRSDDTEKVVIRLAGGGDASIPKSRVVEILPAYDSKELTALKPEAPGEYFRLGEKLIKAKEDPEAMELGRRLLLLSAYLGPDDRYEKAYALLADTAADPVEQACCIYRLLVANPAKADVAKRYAALKARVREVQREEIEKLLAAVRDPGPGGKDLAACVRSLRTIPARTLAKELPSFIETLDTTARECPRCGGSGWRKCERCDGFGAVRCGKCRGRGYQPGSSKSSSRRSGRTRPSRSSSAQSCDACDACGLVKCPVCQGKGVVPCCSPAGDGKEKGLLRRIEKQLVSALDFPGEGYPWLKAPTPGARTFEPDLDYTKTIFREGQWVKPAVTPK